MGRHACPEVDIARLEHALETVAELLLDNPAYTPIFERLEAELAAARTREDTRSRALDLIRAARANRMDAAGAVSADPFDQGHERAAGSPSP